MNTFQTTLIAALTGASTLAAAQTAYLERAQVLAAGSQIQTFRLPAKGTTGAIKYWDMTVEVSIGANGKPEAVSIKSLVASPKFLGSDFIAGKYLDANGAPCTVTTGLLDGGRQEGAFTCTNGDSPLAGSWTSGPVAGHPLEIDLRAAGIDLIAGQPNYAWGKVASVAFNRTVWNCFNTNEIISARQAGNQIVISNYGADNVADCGMTLTLQEP